MVQDHSSMQVPMIKWHSGVFMPSLILSTKPFGLCLKRGNQQVFGQRVYRRRIEKSTDSWLQGRKIGLGVDGQLANLLESYQYLNRDLNWYTDFENKSLH